MIDLWYELPVLVQDALLTALLLLPVAVIGAIVMRGFAPWPLLRAMLRRFAWANALFMVLIAVSVGLGVALLEQERGLRAGTATAADKFDLVITAPGSEVTMLLASVYLQPTDAPLLSGETYDEVAREPEIAFAAPLAFGDSVDGHPIVGTTAAFVAHLSGGVLEGRIFSSPGEAVIGYDVSFDIGQRFEPAHGVGIAAEEHAHEGVEIEVVGRMPRSGTPWDRAAVVPVEEVWETHGFFAERSDGTGQAEDPLAADEVHHDKRDEGTLGPPFPPGAFFGTPAIVVHPKTLAAAYALRSKYQARSDTMAFFPGAVLSRLYVILGDIRQVMSVMAIVTQAVVALSVLAGLTILVRLFQRNVALLRALGAPGRFVVATIWSYTMVLMMTGALVGLIGGHMGAVALAAIISTRTDISISASLGWPEIQLVAAFVTFAALAAFVPAVVMLRGTVVRMLRR